MDPPKLELSTMSQEVDEYIMSFFFIVVLVINFIIKLRFHKNRRKGLPDSLTCLSNDIIER